MPTTKCQKCERDFTFKPKVMNLIGGAFAALIFFPVLAMLFIPLKRSCTHCGSENKALLWRVF